MKGADLMSDLDPADVPLFCPVCDYAMNVDTDLSHFLISGACFECTIHHFEKNRELWNQGWRPNLKTSSNGE
jgi:hypothetical protein